MKAGVVWIHAAARVGAALALVLGLFMTSTPGVAATELVVGVPRLAPDIDLTRSGRLGGIQGELLREIAKRADWSLKPRLCTWHQCMALLRAGRIDLLPNAARTPERARALAYPHIPILYRSHRLFVPWGADVQTLSDLAGLRVGVLSGSVQEKTLPALLEKAHIDAYIVPVDDLSAGFGDVGARRLDAMVADDLAAALPSEKNRLVASGVVLPTTPLYYAARKGIDPKVLTTIDAYLNRWQNQPDSPYFQVMARWGSASAWEDAPLPQHWSIMLAVLLAVAAGLFAWWEHRHGRHLLTRLQSTAAHLDRARSNLLEQSQLHEHIRQLVFHDGVTDLASKSVVDARIQQAITSAQHREALAAVAMLDIDGFKHINDGRGRATGDLVLREVARRLVRNTQARDTVSRTNSNEFTILLPSLGSEPRVAARRATRIAEKLHQALTEQPIVLPNGALSITVSGGVTILGEASQTADACLHEAGIAMHQAQRLGGNHVIAYDEQVRREVALRHSLERAFGRAAVGLAGFELHVQPQFSFDGTVTGAELLARWRHPKLGPIPPDVFIPLAREVGLLDALTELVLEQACAAVHQFQALGEPYPLSVNVSPQTLAAPGFVQVVERVLTDAQVAGGDLIFEITEEIQIADVPTVLAHMQALRALGVRFSMDDFGTGYANLAYLRQLPLHEIKLDRSLIEGIPENADGVSITRLSLTLARRLGLRVVAEGVERQAQADFLFRHRCDAIQGYLLARPTSVADWLEHRAAAARPLANAMASTASTASTVTPR